MQDWIAMRFGLLGLVALAVGVAAASGNGLPRQPNAIVVENSHAGTPAWYGAAATPHAIEGYTSEVSAAPGEVVHFHVSTAPAERYRIDIFRLGWYGRVGGRLMACLPSCKGQARGAPRPLPTPSADLAVPERAYWPATNAVRIPGTWTSGYYEAWFQLRSGSESGRGSAAFFIVRAPRDRHDKILVQVPVNTWQAYNDWGGRGL